MKPIELEEFENQDIKTVGFINIICFLLFILPFFQLGNPSIHQIKEIHNNISFPIAIIDYHTSQKTFYRIHYLLSNYWQNNTLLKNNIFQIRLIYSNLVNLNLSYLLPNSSFPLQILTVNTSDSIQSLSQRIDSSYKSFLNDNKAMWLYRATDDSFIDFDNLFDYIQHLNLYYDPMHNLVVRAHANFELKSNYFIHGGPGYLMSRSYVQYHFDRNYTLSRLECYSKYNQDDTAESLILQQVYEKSYRQWDEFYIDGFLCSNCELYFSSFQFIPKCPPNRRIGSFQNIIAIHLFGLEKSQLHLLNLMKMYKKMNANDNLYYYNYEDNQSMILCTSKYRRYESYNFNHHRQITKNHLVHKQLDFHTLEDQLKHYPLFEIKY